MAAKVEITKEMEKEILNLYLGGLNTLVISNQFKTSNFRIRDIIKDNNIKFRRGGVDKGKKQFYDFKIPEKYIDNETTTYKAVCKQTKKEFTDYNDKHGYLAKHIQELYNIEKPKIYQKKEYFYKTGNHWYEEYFDIIQIPKEIKETKKCKYCDWETIDLENRSGYYKIHLQKEHGIIIDEYLKQFPEELEYFKKDAKRINFEETPDKHIKCEICGKKFKRINKKHLESHNITKEQYIKKYGNNFVSNEQIEIMRKIMKVTNTNMVVNNSSKPEKEISEFIKGYGFEIESNNRKLLQGKEIDILIPELKIGIEYNGNNYHTEKYGKKLKFDHLYKTNKLNELGYNLIQIFEDEYVYKKELVFQKIKRILKIKNESHVLGARKCIIKEIDTDTKKYFLEKYHIQGDGQGCVKLGAYFNNELIGVMVFKKRTETEWELTRFATNYEYSTPGLGTKFLKYFIKTYSPKTIISFADRRWTLDKDNNLYVKMGFKLDKILKPDYRYYNLKRNGHLRLHKFGFRKQILHKKYGLPLSMTESEMVEVLGYQKIWDCGLFKYKLIIE